MAKFYRNCATMNLLLTVNLMLLHTMESFPVASASTQCNEHNKNPCKIFPDLCSAGGGLCVTKAPCEYQCVCPPNGRISRDCTSNTSIETGTFIESLLIFPEDPFWYLNDTNNPDELIEINTEAVAITTTTKATTDPVLNNEPKKSNFNLIKSVISNSNTDSI